MRVNHTRNNIFYQSFIILHRLGCFHKKNILPHTFPAAFNEIFSNERQQRQKNILTFLETAYWERKNSALILLLSSNLFLFQLFPRSFELTFDSSTLLSYLNG